MTSAFYPGQYDPRHFRPGVSDEYAEAVARIANSAPPLDPDTRAEIWAILRAPKQQVSAA